MYSFNKSRRDFFKTVTFAGGTLFISGLGAYFIYRNPETVDSVISKLERHQKGRVIRDRILLEEYRTDFGKVVIGEPRVVVIPHDEQDIIAIFKIANELQVPVSIRGAGHTCFGQSLSDGGILLVNRSLN
ncbi:MAG: FAD-binding oxidoreductase, partial [Deltaproteobacteria bacterium]|nr:FAD-binding oxidoreductase [Deltaproteobacteria bacterium]